VADIYLDACCFI
jgi:predicted nucleic acid-binding protein